MSSWFSHDLAESKYQLGLYERLLTTEKYVNGIHIEFFEEMIRRYKHDIKLLENKS